MRLRIINVSIGTADPATMEAPAREAAAEAGFELDIRSFSSRRLENDPVLFDELCKLSADADLVLVRCIRDPEKFKRMPRYTEVLKKCNGYVYVHSTDMEVRLSYRYLFSGSDEDYLRVSQYVSNRGDDNDRGIVRWLAARKGLAIDVPEPSVLRPHGIYHPDHPRDISLGDYLSTLDPRRPRVGIIITGSYWIYHNLAHIDFLIRRLESAGLSTIPVFFNAVYSADGHKCPMSDVFSHYFMAEGEPIVDAVISNNPFSHLVNLEGIRSSDEGNFYRNLTDVPVLQAMMITNRYSDYEESKTDGDHTNLMTQAAWTEMDGQVITVPISEVRISDSGVNSNHPLEDRIECLVHSVSHWIRLRRRPRSERKVAIVLYQYGGEGTIGTAAGLDAIESADSILKAMRDGGYTTGDIPETGRALADMLLAGVNNEFRNLSSNDIERMAPGLMGPDEYSGVYSEVPEFDRRETEAKWGPPMGDILTDRGRAVIPGVMFGNVLVTVQPVRAWGEQSESVYHDPELFPPHQYLAYYRWLRDDFGADALIHVGTHGSLEWLPGKSLGLSAKCCPSYIQDGLVNIYPYLIDDPGEGIQAKRRSQAVLIGHMCPTMTRAGEYDDIAAVDRPLQEYIRSKSAGEVEHCRRLVGEIRDVCERISLLDDLGIPAGLAEEEFEGHIDRIHDYIMEVKDSLVRDGIHVLGRVPEGEKLDESVYSLTRLPNGEVPSFRDSVASAMGTDVSDMERIDEVDAAAFSLIERFRGADYDESACLAIAEEALGEINDPLCTVIGFICGSLVPNLRRMSDEIGSVMEALDGRYVLPGPSGAPTRGHADILPMGRNYYSIDPDCIPTRSAWETGRAMADQFVSKYVEDKGEYPREVGFIVWATDTMKTDGDDIAYALWLMGVRPVWSATTGQVVGLEPVPLEELGRPRADVTIRISGLFRDAYPNLIDLLDDAVKLASGLEESDEDNALAANLRRDVAAAMSEGLPEDEARKKAAVRIFGSPPGCYGPGMNHAIDSGDWKTLQDLADLYVAWGSYAYGRDYNGVQMKDEFMRGFGRVSVTVKNLPDREIDMIDMDDVYGYLGGLNAFVKTYGRKDAVSYMGDSSDPGKTTVRFTEDELKFVFRRKVLNPKFIEGLKEHGFRGVGEISKMTDYIFGWDATSEIVEKWMYDGLAERYLLDEDTAAWMEKENPYAMMDIVKRLLEAVERGMWDADDDMKDKLRDLYLRLEEMVEGEQNR